MKDIPMFTTQLGVASLTLSEIPYTQRAYIRIQASEAPAAFLQECRDFCRFAGAEQIYATGCDACENYPVHTAIVQMKAEVSSLGDTDANLFPVTEQTLESFREIYNRKAVQIPNAAWMSMSSAQKLLKEGGGYWIHQDGKLIGTGILSGSEISWVSSVVSGGGKTVVQALCHAVTGEIVCLQVASANIKAVRLYEDMGFIVTGEISRWYQIT